jgi:hypothetical protein
MSKQLPILNLYDRVRYMGEKFSNLRSQNAIGEIVGKTNDGLLSVSYGDDAYILHPSNLVKVNFAEDSNEVAARRWEKKAKVD